MNGTQQEATAQVGEDAEYEAVLSAVTAVGKANAGLVEGDVVTDADEDEAERGAAAAVEQPAGAQVDDDEDEEEESELAKAAAPFMDASPLVAALVASNDRLAKGQRLLAREMRAMRRDQGVMAKSNALLLTQNHALREEIEAIGNGGTGRKSVVQRPMAKSTPVVDPAAHPNDGLFGPDLMGKATAASLTGDCLSARELSALNEYALLGSTLGDIRNIDPELAGRVDGALATLKT